MHLYNVNVYAFWGYAQGNKGIKVTVMVIYHIKNHLLKGIAGFPHPAPKYHTLESWRLAYVVRKLCL